MRFKTHLISLILLLLPAGLAPASAQMSAADLVMRLDMLENQMRQLTGQVEQLQYRNQQLEQQLRRTTEDYEFRFQELGGKGAGTAPRAAQPQRQPVPQNQQVPGRRSDAAPAVEQPVDQRMDPYATDPRTAQRGDPRAQTAAAPVVAPPTVGGRRGDAFDPNAMPNAPGAPRALGSLPAGQPSVPQYNAQGGDAMIGAGGGREPGSPLDLSTLAGNAANDPDLRGAGARQPGGSTIAAVVPPSNSPRDHFDLGYGYIQRKEYAAAEETFREFIARHPGDRLSADANYWLGESLFRRQRYQDAAEAYLVVTTKYETAARAPDALLRLGQSLAAIGQKEMAYASFPEVGRKYPRSSVAVKQGVEREQKRVRC